MWNNLNYRTFISFGWRAGILNPSVGSRNRNQQIQVGPSWTDNCVDYSNYYRNRTTIFWWNSCILYLCALSLCGRYRYCPLAQGLWCSSPVRVGLQFQDLVSPVSLSCPSTLSSNSLLATLHSVQGHALFWLSVNGLSKPCHLDSLDTLSE